VVDVVARSVLEFLVKNFNCRAFLESEGLKSLDAVLRDRRLANRF